MRNDVAEVVVLALLAMANPSLLAAVTVMLLLPNPKLLMTAYLLGTYTTSLTVGLVIVFSLHDASFTKTSRHQISPVQDIVLGVVALVLALVIRNQRVARLRQRRRERKRANRPPDKTKRPWHERMLGSGSAPLAFVVGALLSFPGVTYLGALDRIINLNAGAISSILLVVFFCVMQQILLEVPLLSYVFAPTRTQAAVAGFKDFLRRRGRTLAVILMTVIGLALILRGVLTIG
jgi:Sap, sulfolipid-1-addressing protein